MINEKSVIIANVNIHENVTNASSRAWGSDSDLPSSSLKYN